MTTVLLTEDAAVVAEELTESVRGPLAQSWPKLRALG
jgi:hypothetical protein